MKRSYKLIDTFQSNYYKHSSSLKNYIELFHNNFADFSVRMELFNLQLLRLITELRNPNLTSGVLMGLAKFYYASVLIVYGQVN